MNSLTLLQLACAAWLTEQDQSNLPLPEVELLLAAVNGATSRVWRQLPAHYRRQTFSCGLEASVTGTITATQGSRAATFSFTGTPQANEGREFCTIIAGSVRNEYRNGALLHPWQDSTGTHAATIYHDATIKLGYLVERLLAPMQELRKKEQWTPVPTMESTRLWCSSRRYFDLQRVSFLESDGDRRTRSLFRVAKLDGSARLFESVVTIAPPLLGIVDSAVPSDLYVDDEVGEAISQAAGIELQTHPRWRGKDVKVAVSALDRLREISPKTTSDPESFGTPEGW